LLTNVIRRPPDHDDDSSRAHLLPTDLRAHHLPTQAARGFHRGSTEELLGRAADTIERLNRELADIRQARESWKRERARLEGQLEEAKTRAELVLGEAMVDAHKAGQALRTEAEADAENRRAEAEALLERAREEAKRLVDDARGQAGQLLSDAAAECERSAAEAEQYKLLAAEVQRRSVTFLRHALEALGEDVPSLPALADEVAAFRSGQREAAGE
jgi:cell division septum initiation protein DivIVA